MRTQKQIREETARRRKAGIKGNYAPVTKKTESNTPLESEKSKEKSPPKTNTLPLFKLNEGDCQFLGKKAPGESCRSGIYICDKFKAKTARHVKCSRLALHCPTCTAHVPKAFNPLADHFNAGCFEWKGRNYIVSRKGWTGSNIFITEVGKDFQTVEGLSFPRVVGLYCTQSRGGREDARFFTSRGVPFLSFIGVQLVAGRTKTNQLYAQLDDNLRLVKVLEPELEGRKFLEKNWSFFDHGSAVHSVYSISPHVVLRHDGAKCERIAETPWYPPWTGKGHMRGGASPVRVGNEFYHFFHGMNYRANGHKEYTIGLYTFAATPPFAPKRGPILVIDTPPDRLNWGSSVVFPCGAVLRDGYWYLSYGLNDETFEVAKLDAGELDRRLTREPDPKDWFDPSPVLALPGWCSVEKAISAFDIVRRAKVKAACEVGVYGGRWSIAVALAMKRNGVGKLYCVDAWDYAKDTYTDDPEYVKFWSKADLKPARAAFLQAVKEYGLENIIEVIESDSRTGAPRVPDGLDLLHIDGCHDRNTSCHDAVTYGAKVKRGGYIAFDDSHWQSVQDALAILASTCGLERDYTNWRLYRKF